MLVLLYSTRRVVGRNLILNDFVGYSKNLLISLIGHDILPGSGDVVVGRGCSEIVQNKI